MEYRGLCPFPGLCRSLRLLVCGKGGEETGVGKGGGRYRTRAAAEAAAVTQSGGRLRKRPVQEAGGGDVDGRHGKRAAATGGRYMKWAAAAMAAVT